MDAQPSIKTSEPQAETMQMTYEEFLAWAGEDVHAEWVNGKVLTGFWLRVAWLWADQPDVLRALAEIVGPEQVSQALRRAAEPSK